MKLEYLQKIIARIQNQIHCPKCKAQFEADKIEIQAVKGNQVEFSVECSQCTARSQISAEISSSNAPSKLPKQKIAEPPVKRSLPGFELPNQKLKSENLKSLKSHLSNFKGSDINSLFE